MLLLCCHTAVTVYANNYTGNPDVPDQSLPPPSYVYMPNHCQVVFANLSFNRERNLGVLTAINFNKLDDHTVLRITWEVCSHDPIGSHDPMGSHDT